MKSVQNQQQVCPPFRFRGLKFCTVKNVKSRGLPQIYMRKIVKVGAQGSNNNEAITFRFGDDGGEVPLSIEQNDVVTKSQINSKYNVRIGEFNNMKEEIFSGPIQENNSVPQSSTQEQSNSNIDNNASTERGVSNVHNGGQVGQATTENGESLDEPFSWDKAASLSLDKIEFILDGPPRVSSPIIADQSKENLRELPLLLYLPGVDGTGFAAAAQFSHLSNDFDVKCFTIPPSDRTSFTDLVANVKQYLIHEGQDNPVSRPIYLLGESLGGLLAMAVAAECSDIVDRVILVNPPSNYLHNSWRSLAPLLSLIPDQVYEQFPAFMLPMLINPAAVAQSTSPTEFVQQLLQDVQKKMPQAMSLSTMLPVDTLQWKFECMSDGCEYLNKIGYKNIQQRTLIITGSLDFLTLSSRSEGPRLEKVLPRAKNIRIEDHGFVILQDKDFNLASIIKENNFYITSRRMSSFPVKGGKKIREGNKYAQAGPIEIPNLQEMQEDMDRIFFNLAHKTVSPRFFSTDNNGTIFEGLQNVPEGEQILLIGNHQPFPLDFSFIVEKFLRERGTLIRTLIHPLFFMELSNMGLQNEGLNDFIRKTMFKYGVVPVSPNNMHKLMHLGESLIMLPGGALEVTKSSKMKHKLIWPESAEFVRMASKFNVTIIPFSSVGGEEFLEILSAEDIVKMPIVGDIVQEFLSFQLKDINPRAWQGQLAKQPSQLLTGLSLPTLPARYYIKFGKPVKTDSSWVKDKEKCSKVYLEVKDQVQSGMDYLLQKRNEDPYQEFVPRMIYEAMSNFSTQAPTFSP